MSLYDDTVKLAHDNPGPLQRALLPVLKKHASLPWSGKSDEDFVDWLTNLQNEPMDPEYYKDRLFSELESGASQVFTALRGSRGSKVFLASKGGYWPGQRPRRIPGPGDKYYAPLVSDKALKEARDQGVVPSGFPVEVWFRTAWTEHGRWYPSWGYTTAEGREVDISGSKTEDGFRRMGKNLSKWLTSALRKYKA